VLAIYECPEGHETERVINRPDVDPEDIVLCSHPECNEAAELIEE
jgi:hypothetical protein